MCIFLFFFFIKISKFALPGEMLMYERISIERKVHFSKSFFRKNIGDFTDLHNEKNQIWKFHVNGIVTVTRTPVNVYQIL